MLIGIHTYTTALTTIDKYYMYNTFLTNARRQTYLFKCFNNTL